MKLSHWLLAAVPLLLQGCTDRQPLATNPPAAPTPQPLGALECRADVRARAVRCAEPTPGSGARALILGGQNSLVRLASSAVSYDSATGVFSADVAVENLLNETLATPDGVTTDPEGIRVFFQSGPAVTAGSGQATVANPDGTGTFTAAGQPFFRYPGTLAPHDTTAAKTWRFQLDKGVVAFAFRVYLDVKVEPRLVITEIMARPLTPDETAGEWFEVYNASGVRIDLDGFTLASGGDAGYTFSGSLTVLSGEHVVLGASADSLANGRASVRHAYTGITLGNDDADWLALRTPTGIAVDSVSWGGAAGDVPSPPSPGVARSLVSRDSPNVNLSGAHSAWEDAVGTYGPALQRGTPGRANLRGVRGGLSISAGYQHTCMTDRDGAAWCWGLGSTYQLGTGGTGSAFTLARAAAPAGVRLGRVSLAGNESCALSFLGEAYCWGYRPGGYASVPTSYPNAAASLVTSVAAGGGTVGGGSVCEIDPAGAAYCWGNVAGDYYFLWIAQTAVSPAMTWPVSQMALGTDFACALGNGRVYCYGLNAAGQVGDSTTSFRPKMTETRLPQGVTFRSIAAAFQTACALSDAGQAYCWGKNQSGQLGNGTSSAGANPMPVAVQQPAGVAFTALSMGEYQGKAVACGLDADGQAWCWGQNDNGRVGDGTEAQRLVPTAVAQRGVRFTALAVGGVHTCALEAGTGQPFCWGANVGGAVGDGSSTAKRLIPVPAIRQ